MPRSPSLIPAYRDLEQREAANQLGMWTFIATEVLFFGGLFVAYTVYRSLYPEAFANGSRHLEFAIGTANTAVLLTSSVSMALADVFAKEGRRRATGRCLLVTMSLGALFLVLKGVEYAQKFSSHEVPGAHFQMDGPPQSQLFILLYFAMTGLHALHMLIGLGVMVWLWRLNQKGRFSRTEHAPLEMAGLYWHFVDCVWVVLYPLLYLVR